MEKNIESDGVKSNGSIFIETTEDVAPSFLASAASAATVQSPRPSVVFSTRDESSNSPLQKLQRHVTKMLKGFTPSPEAKGAYNPEVLTSQKRQWASFQLKSSNNRCMKEPSELFESMVIVGIHPHMDVQMLENIALGRDHEDAKKPRNFLSNQHQVHAASNIEPQILFAYPPEKPLPLKYKDLLSFCFPGGVQVHAVERTPSCSELNEILLGQEQLTESKQSFVFRLQVADDSTLYGCCILVQEIVQKPSNLVSILIGEQVLSSMSRYVITTPRCYCILSRLPFFDLHFGVLRSIFVEERLECLKKGIDMLNLLSAEETPEENGTSKQTNSTAEEQLSADGAVNLPKSSELSVEVYSPKRLSDHDSSMDNGLHEMEMNGKIVMHNKSTAELNQEEENLLARVDTEVTTHKCHDDFVGKISCDKPSEMRVPNGVLPPFQCRLNEGSESSSSFQGFPYVDRSYRSNHEMNMEEPSSIGHEELNGLKNHHNILELAKAKSCGSLEIICKYHQLQCPRRGTLLTFQPLEHLYPLKYQRPGETILHIAGSTIDVRSCDTSQEVAEVNHALLAEEESTALSVWTVACICGCLRLENVMTLFAAALLEKQIVIVCSNLGILSASVLSIIPLIRPYQWQSLLMPVLPNAMVEFLDAPVPYIVGVQTKIADVQSRLSNVVLIDANKNQVKSASIPQLPQQKELLSSLRPFHSKLVGESFLARKRSVYECTDVQIEAAKGFLAVLRSYLDSLCSNLRSHTITNVQSNRDKVSLLLRESFLGSFPSRDQHFMKLFVDTQLFSVHTDLVLSFYQKD